MFTEDIMADPSVAPQIFDDPRTPKLRIYAREEGPGNPDIVTERTEAYILFWEETDPSVWEQGMRAVACGSDGIMSKEPIRANSREPYHQFIQDIIADPDLAPQLSDSDRVPAIEVYAKGTFPDRPPDISTPRTDVYIVGWEVKDPDDPFYKDWPESE